MPWQMQKAVSVLDYACVFLHTALLNLRNDSVKDFLQSSRRSLHRHPEIMYELPFTSNTIAGILE